MVFRRGGGIFNAATQPQTISHVCSTLGRDVTAGTKADMRDLFDTLTEEPDDD